MFFYDINKEQSTKIVSGEKYKNKSSLFLVQKINCSRLYDFSYFMELYVDHK